MYAILAPISEDLERETTDSRLGPGRVLHVLILTDQISGPLEPARLGIRAPI